MNSTILARYIERPTRLRSLRISLFGKGLRPFVHPGADSLSTNSEYAPAEKFPCASFSSMISSMVSQKSGHSFGAHESSRCGSFIRSC